MGAAAFAASLATPALAHADPIRILLAVSHSRGAPGELPLLHAAADVEHVQRVLTDLGDFPSADVITLVDPTLASLDGALARARALAAAHTPDEVTFVFYFSGHGDRDQIQLGPEALPTAELSARVRAIPAALRLVVTDACRNYPTRVKGIATEPGFAIQNPAAPPGEGVVWLYSSREGESSLESDELAGALFTHYWVSALRGAGDANGDGRVTLGESYDFAYSQTLLRSSRSSGVLQHPSAVFDLREAAPIVLTKTAGASAIVRFPRAADAHFLVYAIGSRAVVGELWGSADRDVAFALPRVATSSSAPPAPGRRPRSSRSRQAKPIRSRRTNSTPSPRSSSRPKGATSSCDRTSWSWSSPRERRARPRSENRRACATRTNGTNGRSRSASPAAEASRTRAPRT